jgi:hypothetical protein
VIKKVNLKGEIQMYCPYCKEELKIKDGELYCETGNSYFSKRIENRFEEAIRNSQGDQINNDIVENSMEGIFHCVNCGQSMHRTEPMHEVCICCGFEINKSMFYEIIELNPHCSV